MPKFGVPNVAHRYEGQIRITRWICAGGAGIMLVVSLYLVNQAEASGVWTRTDTTVIAFAAVTAFALGGGIWKWGPGAVEVSVDETAIRFTYPSRRTRTIGWDSLGFMLIVDRTAGIDDAISHGTPMAAVQGRRWLQDFLSPEALQAILSEARKRNFNVTEGEGLRPGWTRMTISRPA